MIHHQIFASILLQLFQEYSVSKINILSMGINEDNVMPNGIGENIWKLTQLLSRKTRIRLINDPNDCVLESCFLFWFGDEFEKLEDIVNRSKSQY